jgi:hypothetical protein
MSLAWTPTVVAPGRSWELVPKHDHTDCAATPHVLTGTPAEPEVSELLAELRMAEQAILALGPAGDEALEEALAEVRKEIALQGQASPTPERKSTPRAYQLAVPSEFAQASDFLGEVSGSKFSRFSNLVTREISTKTLKTVQQEHDMIRIEESLVKQRGLAMAAARSPEASSLPIPPAPAASTPAVQKADPQQAPQRVALEARVQSLQEDNLDWKERYREADDRVHHLSAELARAKAEMVQRKLESPRQPASPQQSPASNEQMQLGQALQSSEQRLELTRREVRGY